MEQAAKLGIPIIGICRGAQMLCALNGGYLIQHVNGHAGCGHSIRTQEGRIINVNSIHHQMMQPQGTKHELVAWSESSLSDVYYDVDTLVEVDIEPEYIRFPDINGFAMQWHPEMMDEKNPANQYLLQDITEQLKL
jgi:putative glutamine amidotransferase